MAQNSTFWLLRGHRFGHKIQFTVMSPNHGGHPLGSILGPMGFHWGPKMGQTVKNYHASKLEFLTTPRSSIWTKNRIDAYGAKSWWGHPRVHLGANGVPLGQKNGSKPWKNYHGAEFYFLTTPRSLIWAKNRIYGYGAKSRLGPPWVHLRANGFLLGQKNGSKP